MGEFHQASAWLIATCQTPTKYRLARLGVYLWVVQSNTHCLVWQRSRTGVKFPLGTELGSASPPPTLILTISGGKVKLTQDQCLAETSPYTMSP
jgi:hypothetical protein